jgi:hypothetical protein
LKTNILRLEKENPQDLSPTEPDLIEYNLSLTYEERLLNHQHALETINEIIKARTLIYGELDPSTQTSS